eukprot:c21334_g1_i1 orf=253-678(-)
MACIIKPMTLGPQFYRETQLTAFNCKLRSTNAKLINPRKCHLGSIKACNWHTTEDNLHPERGLQKSPFLHSSWSSADIQRPENATNLQLINLLAFSWAEMEREQFMGCRKMHLETTTKNMGLAHRKRERHQGSRGRSRGSC